MVSSPEPDASHRPSCEKATDQTQCVWPSSVCCRAPVSVSQIRTVLSSEPDASRRLSCEKATDRTQSVWPSSVCKQRLQLSATFGQVIIHDGSSSRNIFRIILFVGLNMRADAYT